MDIIKALNKFLKSNPIINNTLWKFEIWEQKWQGWTSIVRVCKLKDTDNEYIIKFLLENIWENESWKYLRFKQSYINLLSLNHNLFIIPQIYLWELHISEKLVVPYIIMHKAEQWKLAIAKSFEDFHEKFNGILEAISFIHEHNIIHRDIKPENIFLYDWRYVLADFDISWFDDNIYLKLKDTEKNERLWNFHYSAPEQLSWNPVLESDWFAFWQILHYLITWNPLRWQGIINFSSYGQEYVKFQNLVRLLISEDVANRPKSKDDILKMLKKEDEEEKIKKESLEQIQRIELEKDLLEKFDDIIREHTNDINKWYKLLKNKKDIELFLLKIWDIVEKNSNFIRWKQEYWDSAIQKIISLNTLWNKYFSKNNFYLLEKEELNIDKIYIFNWWITWKNFFIVETKPHYPTWLYKNDNLNSEEYCLYNNCHKITRTELDNWFVTINWKIINLKEGISDIRVRHLNKDIFFIWPRWLFFNNITWRNNEAIIRTFFELYYENNNVINGEIFDMFISHKFLRYKPWEVL